MADWPVSDLWDPARRSGFAPLARAEVWTDGVKGPSLAVTGGQVTVDERSKVRRTLTLTVADLELDPRDAADLLAPFGVELRVFAGMRYTNIVEEVPVGVFTLEGVSRSGWATELSLSGMDRAGVLAEARFLTPWNTRTGTLVTTEIAAMIHSVMPTVEVFDLTDSDAACRAAVWDRERWDAIGNLAAGIGAECFFDQAGRAVIRPVPTVAGMTILGDEPLAITANQDDSDLLDVATAMSRAGVFNAVVASSDQEKPVTSIAYQRTGPLRYRAAFAKPRFFSTPVVRSSTGIAAAAVSMLARSLAFSRKVDPQIVPDASADAGSLVTITLPDDTTTTRILSSFTLPLGVGSMTTTTRVDADPATTDDTTGLS